MEELNLLTAKQLQSKSHVTLSRIYAYIHAGVIEPVLQTYTTAYFDPAATDEINKCSAFINAGKGSIADYVLIREYLKQNS